MYFQLVFVVPGRPLAGDGMGAWQVGWPLAGHLFGGGGLGEFGKTGGFKPQKMHGAGHFFWGGGLDEFVKTGGFKPKKMHGWIQEKHILKAFIPVDGSRNCVL